MNWFKIVGNRVSAMRTGAVSKGHDDLSELRKQPILLCWNDEKHDFSSFHSFWDIPFFISAA
jgi:hypothetical protein